MFASTFTSLVLFLSFTAAVLSSKPVANDALKLPFSTKGRDIVDKNGGVFLYKGTNWPGHQEIMIPEGLQHSSVADIVAWIPKFGLNSVRMTFAIEMIDDYYNNNPNQTLEKSVINALGLKNGTIVLKQILEKNPQFTNKTTRLEVWDAVAKELARQNIVLHLDNHVSKAFWCCAGDDGNGWFGEKYFDVKNWIRGWTFIAKHVRCVFLDLTPTNQSRGEKIGPALDRSVSAMNFVQPHKLSRLIGTLGTYT